MAAGTGAVAAVVLGLTALAAQSPKADPPKPGPDDLPGRVVDKSGAGVADVQVWAIDGPGMDSGDGGDGDDRRPGPVRGAVARSTHVGRPGAQNFGLFARARDGRVGWQRPVWRNSADGKGVEIELRPVGDVRGRLTDQNARPIAGVEVATELHQRVGRAELRAIISGSAPR